ncbi:hypothetical protein W911_03525 [Hyphomicrobium nitrativorans NL23]|uniref:Uncharacterized protein n=1 Tax=Hyphomicrobium nitrativorans NL23 TaxID=1029756 RepID=V5SAB4_9HYPH|nr:hypothetical protein [Hyphomicrobium nitrativorans]AHB47691.1 hypothetical protein W911_03525 [Hyphomicrobium nitrativorans NL23]
MASDPVLIAFAVRRATSSNKPVWTRIGCAYPHDTGAGLTVVLDALPTDGRIVLLERDFDDDERILRQARKRGALT